MLEEKETVKWGVMGTAGIASWGTIPGMQKAKGCELYAIAGRSLEKDVGGTWRQGGCHD